MYIQLLVLWKMGYYTPFADLSYQNLAALIEVTEILFGFPPLGGTWSEHILRHTYFIGEPVLSEFELASGWL